MCASRLCCPLLVAALVLSGCSSRTEDPAGPPNEPGGNTPHLTCSGGLFPGSSEQCGVSILVSPDLQNDPSIHGRYLTPVEQLDPWGSPVLPLPASSAFDVTFSEPIVAINIVGFSWALTTGQEVPSTATMTVYDANGGLLATVEPYYYEPGAAAQWIYGYPATGPAVISRVHFDPGGEHLPITIAFDAVQHQPAQLACTPNPVVRGNDLHCEVTEGTNVQATLWHFSSTGSPAHTVAGPSSGLVWEGPVALGGTVSVDVTDGGVSRTLSSNFGLTPRDWSQMTVNFLVIEDTTLATRLPDPPANEHQLGDHLGNAGGAVRSDGYDSISTGPNTGLLYAIARVPVDAISIIRINRAALSVGSAFYLLQPAAHPRRGFCQQSDVVPFTPVAEAHEGLQVEVNSHAWAFINKLNSTAPMATEPATGWDYFDLVRHADSLVQGPLAAARAAAAKIDTTNPITYSCTFKY
jgi:hypothetical protein